MKNLAILGLACIICSMLTLAYWRVTIRQLNAAQPVPSEKISDWGTLWRNYPFFASGMLLSGARPFSGRPNDIGHMTTTYLRIVTMRDRARHYSWFGIVSGTVLIGIAVWERTKKRRSES